MPLYRDGTISLTLGSASVVGLGTEFHENAGPGDLLIIGLDLYEVLSVQGNLALTLSAPAKASYPGTPYTLAKGLLSENVLYLMRKIEEFLSDRQRSTGSFDVWVNGVAGGGDGAGRYPLIDRYGVTRMVKSPLQLEADGTHLTGDLQAALDEAILKLAQLGDFEAAVAEVSAAAAAAEVSNVEAGVSASRAQTSEGASADSAEAAALSFVAADAAETAANAAQVASEASRAASFAAKIAAELAKADSEAALAAAVSKATEAEQSAASALASRNSAEAAEQRGGVALAATLIAAGNAEDASLAAAASGAAALASQNAAAMSESSASADAADADASRVAAEVALTAAGAKASEALASAASADASEEVATTQAGISSAAAGVSTTKASEALSSANAADVNRIATEAALAEALASAGTAAAQAASASASATATAADTTATAADRAIVLTARGEAVEGAVDALAAADAAEGHVEAAAAIRALVEQHGNGWTLAIANVIDGDRRVQRIVSWSGGVGSMPAVGYVGAAGIVATPAEATDLRGGRGADGQGTGTANSVNGVIAVDGDIVLGIANIPDLQQALAAAGQVKTVAGVVPGADGDVPLTASTVGADPAGTAAAEVAELGEALAALAYTGAVSDLEGLSDLLDQKAPISHTHAILQVDGLEAALAGKATTTALATLADVVNQKASATSVVAISESVGILSQSVASKADAGAVGAVDDLDTTEKGSLVGAINEVNAKPSGATVLLPDNFAFNSATSNGVYIGKTNDVNSPYLGEGTGSFTVNISRYPFTDTQLGDYVIQRVTANNSVTWWRGGYPDRTTGATWEVWKLISSYVVPFSGVNTKEVNFNNLQAGGLYRVLFNGMLNGPPGAAGNKNVDVEVIGMNGGDCLQTAFISGVAGTWQRRKTFTTWGQWQEVLTGDLSALTTAAKTVVAAINEVNAKSSAKSKVVDAGYMVVRVDDGSVLVTRPTATGAIIDLPTPVGAQSDMSVTVDNQGAFPVRMRDSSQIGFPSGPYAWVYPGERTQFYLDSTGTKWRMPGRATLVKMSEIYSSYVANSTITNGFDDPELTRMELMLDAVTFSGSSSAAHVNMAVLNASLSPLPGTPYNVTVKGSGPEGYIEDVGVAIARLTTDPLPYASTGNGQAFIKLTIPMGNNATFYVDNYPAISIEGKMQHPGSATFWPFTWEGVMSLGTSAGTMRGLRFNVATGNIKIGRLVQYGYRSQV